MILTALARPGHIRPDENKLNINSSSNVNSNKIDDKIVNLSSNTKKISFEAGFLTFEIGLAFT